MKFFWGRLLDMRSTASRKGTAVTECLLKAQTTWNEETNSRNEEIIKVYYYDTPAGNDAERCMMRKFLVGSTVALAANDYNDPAKPFLKPAKTASKSACIEAMRQKFDEEVQKL